MKNYSFGLKDAKTFILNYEIDGDNMIVHYANKNKDVVPYNSVNEQKVLSKMKEQVYACEKRFSKTRYNIRIYGVSLIILIACNLLIPGFPLVAWLVACVVSSFVNLPIYIKYDDYCKNRMFLKNSFELNNQIKANPNVLNNTKLNTKEFKDTIDSKDPVFDINSIDKVSATDLKIMLENIKRSQDMGYVYSEHENVDTQEKYIVKVLK